MEYYYSDDGYSSYCPNFNTYSYGTGWDDYPHYNNYGNQEFTYGPYYDPYPSYQQWSEPPCRPDLLRRLEALEDKMIAFMEKFVQTSYATSARNQALRTLMVETIIEMKEKRLNESSSSSWMLDSKDHVSELMLESEEEDESCDSFSTKLVESEEEDAETTIPPLLESAITNLGLTGDMVPTNTDTPSSKASVGEIEYSSVIQETPYSKCEDSTFEANTVDCSFISETLDYENPDFLGIEKFLKFGCLDNGPFYTWVKIDQFCDDKGGATKFCKRVEVPRGLEKIKANFVCPKKLLHQPITATTMALAMLAIDGMENFN